MLALVRLNLGLPDPTRQAEVEELHQRIVKIEGDIHDAIGHLKQMYPYDEAGQARRDDDVPYDEPPES